MKSRWRRRVLCDYKETYSIDFTDCFVEVEVVSRNRTLLEKNEAVVE